MSAPSTRPLLRRVLRGLRTALAAASLTLCMAFVFMWGRSYWWVDNVIGPAINTYRPGVACANGWLTVRYANGRLNPPGFSQMDDSE
jgi:hypothetical protein